MNYFEIINKCLVELNYKQVSEFSELIKNDHKKIKNIINILNNEICEYAKWNFLLKEEEIKLPKGSCEIDNTINGKIKFVMADNKVYSYCPDVKSFLTGNKPSDSYGIFNDKILFPEFDEEKTIKIIYLTGDYVTDAEGHSKKEMTEQGDTSVIPMPYAEPLLVYGTCMRLKGNPQHVRFNYWLSMYKQALANLCSNSSLSVDDVPVVKLYRN